MKNNNFLYFMLGALVIAVGLLGYAYFAEPDTSKVSLNAGGTEFSLDVDENGIEGSFEE